MHTRTKATPISYLLLSSTPSLLIFFLCVLHIGPTLHYARYCTHIPTHLRPIVHFHVCRTTWRCTGYLSKAVKRFGEFCSCCCIPLLPQLACSILATWERPYGDSLYFQNRPRHETNDANEPGRIFLKCQTRIVQSPGKTQQHTDIFAAAISAFLTRP